MSKNNLEMADLHPSAQCFETSTELKDLSPALNKVHNKMRGDR